MKILWTICVGLILFIVYVKYLERSSIFYPSRLMDATPVQVDLDYEDVYFKTKDGKQLGGYTGVGISGTEGVFAKIDKDGGTGIAFVNIEDSPTTVTMTAYDDDGNVIATKTVDLNAYEKVVDVPSDLFSTDISNATYITYSSDRNVVGFQLNVSSDGMMLDALPGM